MTNQDTTMFSSQKDPNYTLGLSGEVAGSLILLRDINYSSVSLSENYPEKTAPNPPTLCLLIGKLLHAYLSRKISHILNDVNEEAGWIMYNFIGNLCGVML